VPPYFSVLVLLLIAWGAFAFGAVYDWAYTPLFWAAAAVGLLGIFAPGARVRRPIAWPIVVVAALIALIGFGQLIPLAPATIATLSPATDGFLRTYDLGYQLAATTGAAGYRHALSIDPAGTRLSLAALGALTLLLVGAARGLGQRSLRALASGLVFVGFAVALVGIIQSGLYLRDPDPVLKIYGFWETINPDTRPFGPFVNRNHFAGWMLLALPVAIGYFCALVARGMRGVAPTFRERLLWFSSPDASRVVLVGLAVLVMALSVVLTMSRSGTTCVLIALIVSGWFVVQRQAAGSRRRVTLVYVGAVAIVSLGWAGIDLVLEHFAQAPTDFSSRYNTWKDAWTIFQAFPWLGTGLNTFGTATTLYQTTRLEVHTVEAHNDYAQLLSEGGLALALVVIAALFLLGREIRRRFRENADDQTTYWIRVGAVTGLVAIALQETVEFSLQMPGIAALFAIVAAIAIRPAGDRTDREVAD
jgi:O-antigen ligase